MSDRFEFSHTLSDQDWHGMADRIRDAVGTETDLLWQRKKVGRVKLLSIRPERDDERGRTRIHYRCEVVGDYDREIVDRLLGLGALRHISMAPT